jgi:hypothetical protein
MPRIYFWITSLGVALAVATATATLFPYEALGIAQGVERHRTWLLTVWTSGVMAICFGATGLLSGIVPIGVRDVEAAGSVQAAVDERRKRLRTGESAFYNFAGWTVSTGAFLVLVYFAGWFLGGD